MPGAPAGFPWASNRHKEQIDLGNCMADFMVEVIKTASALTPMPAVFAEHPEDLGATVREEDKAILHPASIWQWEKVRALVQPPFFTVVFTQCCWGAPWKKPTRLISNMPDIQAWGPNQWPEYDQEFNYLGPLPETCSCTGLMPLAKQSNQEGFRTTGTAAYPHKMNQAIAQAAWAYCHRSPPPSTGGGGQRMEEETVGGKEKEKVEVEKEKFETEKEAAAERKERSSAEGAPRGGFGPPIEAYYKGKFRAIHDGGGLGSPGRWKIGQRRMARSQEAVELAATCKKEFLRWTLEKERKPGGVKRLFFELAAGKCIESPFKDDLEGARREVDECLKRQGKRPERRRGDVSAEINFRRLAAMASAMSISGKSPARGLSYAWARSFPARPLSSRKRRHGPGITSKRRCSRNGLTTTRRRRRMRKTSPDK